jgi:hypothetical protein
MRHSYLVSGIRWMLIGGSKGKDVNDLNLETMIAHIRRGQVGLEEVAVEDAKLNYPDI